MDNCKHETVNISKSSTPYLYYVICSACKFIIEDPVRSLESALGFAIGWNEAKKGSK